MLLYAVFRCCAHIAELEHAYFSCADSQTMSLPQLHPDAMRPLPTTSTSDPHDLDSAECVTTYCLCPLFLSCWKEKKIKHSQLAVLQWKRIPCEALLAGDG